MRRTRGENCAALKHPRMTQLWKDDAALCTANMYLSKYLPVARIIDQPLEVERESDIIGQISMLRCRISSKMQYACLFHTNSLALGEAVTSRSRRTPIPLGCCICPGYDKLDARAFEYADTSPPCDCWRFCNSTGSSQRLTLSSSSFVKLALFVE